MSQTYHNDVPERVVPSEVPYFLWQEHINRYVFALHFVSSKVVLDVACGTGYGTELISKVANLAVGVDISREALSYASKSCRKNAHMTFVLADAKNLPFRNDAFDTIISFETIEHLMPPQDFLHQVQSVLKLDGQLIISTPNGKLSSLYRDKPMNPFHLREYTKQEFSNLIGIFSQRPQFYGQCPTFLALFPFVDHHITSFLRTIYRTSRGMLGKIIATAPSSSSGRELDNKIIIDSSYRVTKKLGLYPFYCPTYFIVVIKNEKNL